MPARDGKGPLGQGPSTGRGMGDCVSINKKVPKDTSPGTNQAVGWGSRFWRGTFGRLFGRRRYHQMDRK